jgi:hypothetical protein
MEYGDSKFVINRQLTDVSSIVKNPQKYYKDTLRIKGYFSMSSHNVSIFKEDSWIWIDSFEPAMKFDTVYENLNMHSVEIVGIYDFREKDFMEPYVGKFIKILYIKSE